MLQLLRTIGDTSSDEAEIGCIEKILNEAAALCHAKPLAKPSAKLPSTRASEQSFDVAHLVSLKSQNEFLLESNLSNVKASASKISNVNWTRWIGSYGCI